MSPMMVAQQKDGQKVDTSSEKVLRGDGLGYSYLFMMSHQSHSEEQVSATPAYRKPWEAQVLVAYANLLALRCPRTGAHVLSSVHPCSSLLTR